MAIKLSNNGKGKLAASLAADAGATTVTLQAGDGIKVCPFTIASPDYMYITVVNSSAEREIMKITVKASAGADTFTVVRAQDGTSLKAFAVGDIVECRFNVAILDDIQSQIDLKADDSDLTAHTSATGDSVHGLGNMSTQVNTNVDIDGGDVRSRLIRNTDLSTSSEEVTNVYLSTGDPGTPSGYFQGTLFIKYIP